ncbi:MAG: RNA polymerase sigma factor [Steroidobacteraceae bacterium]
MRELAKWLLHRYAAMIRAAARYAQLIRASRGRGCSREDAREVVQEAHLRLYEYQRSARVRDPNSLLRRIVINLSINLYHREQASPIVPESIRALDRRGVLIDPAPGPERTLAAAQELDRVVSVLSAVSTRTCQIFIAQRGGYSYEEIAAAFAVKPRTIEKHVASAALMLQEATSGPSVPPEVE